MGQRSAERGFTLIELLVVVLLMGLLLSLVSLNIGDSNRSAEVERELQRFDAIIRLALDETMFQNIHLGIRFHRQGFEYLFLDEYKDPVTNDPVRRWVPSTDRRFRPRALPEGMAFLLNVDGEPVELLFADELPEEEDEIRPQVFIYPSGDLSFFQLLVYVEEELDYAYRLDADGLGGFYIETLTEDELLDAFY